MTMRIVIHNNDMSGPIKNRPTIQIAESDMTSAEKLLADIPANLSPLIIEYSDLPDQMFCKAWFVANGKVNVDMDYARELHRNRMRGARFNKLAELDIEFQRALETGTDTKDIVARKQALRDVTKDPGIEAATTTQELRSVWPEILGDNYV
jgi:hypothetical protein